MKNEYPFRMACCGSIGKIEDIHTVAELNHYVCHHMNCYALLDDIKNGTPFALNKQIIKEGIEKFRAAHPELNYEYPAYLKEYLKPVKITVEKKCCGNCEWWKPRKYKMKEPNGECFAPIPDSMYEENRDYTYHNEGENCPCWKRGSND